MPSGTPVTLVTCADVPDGDEDAPALDGALRAQGIDARWVAWDDDTATWGGALTVLRTPWNYTHHLARFLAWADAVPRLVNDAATVRWNTDKTYLRDLGAAGVPIVPSTFAAPGETIVVPDADEFVVKPSVGAGSRGAGRFGRDRVAAARDHAAELQDIGRTVLVQPYLERVDDEGETALLYFAGVYSHAARKAPLLAPEMVHAVGGASLFVPEKMQPREATPEQVAVGAAALAYVADRFGMPLYARVDLLPGADGPVVIELELAEPSLFLGYAPGAAERFAAAVAARL